MTKTHVRERDIGTSSPFGIPVLVAFLITFAAATTWAGVVEIAFIPRIAHPDKPDANPRWGDEFSLLGNMYECFTSHRGERIIGMIFLTFCCCFIVHGIFWFIFRQIMDPKIYKNLSTYDAWFLGQKIPSSLHGLGVGLMAIKILWVDGIFDTDVINGYSPSCDFLMAFSMGYEFYDILVMLLQGESSVGMYIHHMSLCVAYLLSFTHKKLAFVAVVMLITELTVISSNLHWYLKTFQKKATRLFHFNQAIRLWSFIILRLPIPCYVFYHIYLGFDTFAQEHIIGRYAVYIIVSLLSMMNIYWTNMMFYLYINRTTLKQELEKQSEKANCKQK